MSSIVFARMCGFAATAFFGVALAQADVQPTRILCYGDSTTWGQVGNDGVASGQSYPCCLQKILGDKYDVKNISLGGSCAIDMLVWRGVRELRTKPYYSLGNKSVLNDIVLKKDGSFTGIAFTGGSNPFAFVSTGSDDVGLKYNGYPVYGQCNEAGGLFWPSHDGAAFTQAEATQIGLTGNRSGQRAWTDYGEHRAQGIGRCRCYYNPNDASKYVDVEIRYSSSLFAGMRLLESQDADVTIPCGSKIVPIDTTETWKSDLHIIMFGLNDSGFCKNNYWTLVKEATDRIVADGGRYLVLMSHSACASRIAGTKMKEYFGDRYLDLYAKFTEKDENGDYKCFAYAENLGYTNVRTTELQQYAKIPITFATDKYHPLPIAYDLMAHWVYDKLVALGELEGHEPEPGEVAAPTAVMGLKYTGKTQTGVAAATGYTLTGNTATDAGDYTATATLADGYKWSDGTTEPKKIGWSIAKGVNTWKTNPSVSPATWSVDAVPGTITIANGATAFGATVTCDTTEAALKALGEGDRTVTFTAAGTKNYDAITKAVTVSVTSGETPIDPDPPETLLTPTNFTWCGGASGVWHDAKNWQVEPGCSSDYPHTAWANAYFASDADVDLKRTKVVIYNISSAKGTTVTFRNSGAYFQVKAPFLPPENGAFLFDNAKITVQKVGTESPFLTFSKNSCVEFRNGSTITGSIFSGSPTGTKTFTLRDNGTSFNADFNWRSGKSSTKEAPAEIYVTNSVLTGVSESGSQLAVGSLGYTLLHVADGQFHLPCWFTPSGSDYAFRITLGASPETMPTNAPIYFARDVSLSNDVFAVDARACKVAGTYPLVVSGGKSFAVPSDWFDGEGALQATEDFDYTLQVASGMTGKVRQASDYLGLELVLTAGGDDPTPPEGMPDLTAPADGATVAMLTDRQKQAIAHGGESWDGGNLGDNKAHPVVLSWTGTTGPARVTVVRVKDGSTLIDETTDAGTLDAYNMLLGEEYRWTVTTASGSESRTFTVELQAPRVIMVQATNGTDIAELNMRDLGGWVGKDGHRVKQGLLYRSRKLSDPYPEGYDPAAVDGRGYPLMSDAAIFVLANRFGIRTELDFRSQRDQARGIVRSVLGPDVEYINQPMLQPEVLILQSSVGNSMLKANLDVIFNRSKYPLDFHCKDGNSRTGGLAYYLLGLLGVDIMDAAADYMWTKYAVSGKKYWADTDFRHMYANVTTNHAFTAADGTVYDRGTSFMNVCESFTLANGYTMAEIEAFREFMLEDYNAGEDPVVTHKHVWGAWETNVVATCTNEGSRVARCVNDCPDSPVATTNEVLPKLAHQYADGKCVVCGADDPGFVPPGPTPVEGLPEGYTAAAAVTSVNGDSVWFDTFHTPTPDTVSQIRFTFTKDGGAGLYGYLSPSADDANDYRLAATGGKWMLDLGDNKKRIGQSGAAAACGTATANVENYLEIGNYYIKDLAADETLASVTPVTFSRDYTLRIFGKQAGYAAYGSVASLKIFEKGTLVHDFVPCVSPEGVTGLFDLCTSYFHKPDGTFAKVEGGDEPALTPVAAPVAATGLAYTGKPQTGVAAATGYTVTDGAATDAGDYTATATLADGYKWSDGTTEPKKISWAIAKGVNTWKTNPSVSPATWSVDAVPGTIKIANGATAFGATVTCDTTVAALKALGEGDHTVTFTAAAGGKNYDAITKTVTVTVAAGETPEPTEHRDPDTAAVTYTWRNVAGGDWDLASNWSASVDPCYGSPSNATYATAVFPATLVSPLTVTGMGAFPVKQITFGNAAELTLKGMSVTQGNTSGNNISESGVAVTLDGPDTVANFGSFVIGNVSDVRYTVRGGAKHVNTTGRVRYGATSSNVVVRAEGAGTLVDFRSNTAQTPNAYGSDHRWEAVDGAKLYNGANQFIFSDDTRFSQVRPTIRVDNGTVSATTEFRYGTRADAVSPRLEFAGEKPEFTVLGGNKTKSTRITLGTHPEMTGAVTLSYVLPAAGWSVAPFRAIGLGAGGEAYAEIGAKAAFDIDATALGVPAAGTAVTNALMSADAIAVDDPSVLAGAVIRCATGAVGELALSDDGKTLNLVVTASGTPGPQKDPVIPGGESKTYATEAAAIAAKPEKVTPPEDVAQALAEKQEALASYVACFTVATRQNAAGQWVNVAELKPEVEAELQLQVDGGAAKVVDALADVSLTSVTLEPVTPGFRYALEYGETLGTMAPQDSVIATEDSLTLQLPKTAGATSGFYRVKVREY